MHLERPAPSAAPASPTEQWLAGRDLSVCAGAERAGELATELVCSGAFDLPLPGSGATGRRFEGLADVGRADLVLARLAEGHADALAILAELGGFEPAEGLWGVWAANPPGQRLRAEVTGGEWRLVGDKPWCSGAGACAHALVSAEAQDGYRLFAVTLDRATASPVDGTWPAVGMAGSDSRSVRFDGAPATAVGPPGAYLERTGFWWGAAGVAAVWHGGAAGVADALLRANDRRPLGDHALAHLGAIDAALAASRAVLADTARQIDAHPVLKGVAAESLARRARAVVERTATEVLDRVGRALGATPLALDAPHARRVADLTVFLRQSHAERDLQALGVAALASEVSW